MKFNTFTYFAFLLMVALLPFTSSAEEVEIASIYFEKTHVESYEDGITILNKLFKPDDNDPIKMLNYSKGGLKLAMMFNRDQETVSWYLKIAGTNLALANYEEAIKTSIHALDIGTNSKDSHIQGRALNMLGASYHYMNELEKSLFYYHKALSLNINKIKIKSYIGLGNVYRKSKEFDKSEKYLKLALELTPDHNKMVVKKDLAKLYQAMGDFPRSLSLYLECLSGAHAKSSAYRLSGLYVEISSLYHEMEKHEEAISKAMKGVALAREIGSKEHLKELYFTLYESNYQINQYAEANKFVAKYIAIKDSILTLEKANLISTLEARESEKKVQILTKEAENKALKTQRNYYLLFGLTILILAFLVFGILISKQSQLRLKQHALEMEQRLLRAQMNPHFIFNSLVSIQSIIYDDQVEKIEEYLSKFSKLVRLILNNSRHELIPFEQELMTLNYYLEMSAIRFSEEFNYQIQVDPRIQQGHYQIPPMFAQPFIENAIEHGMKNTQGKDCLKIRFLLKPKHLLLEIEDNGAGIKNEKKRNESFSVHKPLATQITHERIKIINKKNSCNIHLKVQEKHPNGTLVSIQFPLNLVA